MNWQCAWSWDDVSKMEAGPMHRSKVSKQTYDYRKDTRKNPMLLGNQGEFLNESTRSRPDRFEAHSLSSVCFIFSHRVAANHIVCLSTQNVRILIIMTIWRHPLDQMLFQTTLNQQLLPLQVTIRAASLHCLFSYLTTKLVINDHSLRFGDHFRMLIDTISVLSLSHFCLQFKSIESTADVKRNACVRACMCVRGVLAYRTLLAIISWFDLLFLFLN